VNVTLCPKTDVAAEEETVVVVLARLTACVSTADGLPTKFPSPL
jgi:hypothetical protein